MSSTAPSTLPSSTPSTTPSTAGPSGPAVPSRRTFLVGSASVAGVGVLAACAPGSEREPGEPTGSSAAPTSDGAVALVAVADVPVGGAVAARTGAGDRIVVAQPKEGTFVAFSAICTHMGCVVEPDGTELACPCHGSVFEAATGANVSGPAPTPLPSVAVTVADGLVLEA